MEQVLNEHFRAILENELWLKNNAQNVVKATAESANSGGDDGRKQAYIGAALVVAGAAFILSKVIWSSDDDDKQR